jgi:hypothetical protein
VQCGEEKSKERTVNSSCVQGSVLGPTLWLIYIQSLLDRLDGECQHYAYADDIAIILKVSTPEEIAKLNKILQILLNWGKEYNMKWGSHKTQRMAFRYHKCGGPPPPEIHFDGNLIQPTKTIESLGVLLNRGCVPYAQIERVRQNIRTMKTLIAKHYRIRTEEILVRLYKTYVLPKLNYCSQQWNTGMEAHLKALEKEIESYWKLLGARKKPPKNIMSLRAQLIYNELKLMHKIWRGQSTIDFDEFFSISELQKTTNKHIEAKTFKHTFAKYTFAHRIHKYWNYLPLSTRNLSPELFKNEIKLLFNSKKHSQKLLNLGRETKITGAPLGINE